MAGFAYAAYTAYPDDSARVHLGSGVPGRPSFAPAVDFHSMSTSKMVATWSAPAEDIDKGPRLRMTERVTMKRVEATNGTVDEEAVQRLLTHEVQ